MNKHISIFLLTLISLGTVTSCGDDFLEREPLGLANENSLSNKEGVSAVLVGAYSLLDGVGSGYYFTSAGNNWIYGEVASDNAYKGSDVGDQSQITTIERYIGQADIGAFNQRWITLYDGVSRANDVLGLLENTTDMTEEEKLEASAEAHFLRAWYHLEAKKMWNNVPYVDETVEDFYIPNDQDIWPMIEADMEFAVENLSATRSQPGRADSWTAKAALAKIHMFQQDYEAAKPLLDDVIDNGPFALVDCFHDNFQITTENNTESILEVQNSVGDGGQGSNGDNGNSLNFPYGAGPGGCCGFFQPSQNLVNAFKTDDNGLPLLESFNEEDVNNDQGLGSDDPFTPYAGNLDPRLDWTVGRRGIPFLNWGVHPGQIWIRDQSFAGPYTAKKHMYYQGENSGGVSARDNANNYRILRLADIILMRAEVAVEENDLATALTLVNDIRTRAANCVVTNEDGSESANYVVNPYPAFPSQEYARTAVRFERRLELALEGHRFFDLVRWGVAAETLNDYLQVESTKRSYLGGASFEAGVDEYFPIPQAQIDIMGVDVLTQNPL